MPQQQSEKATPRTQADRRSETRELLLQAAAAAFAEHGFSGASTDAIAAAAGRTSGALYSHFGSKQGLLAALLDRWEQETTATMGAALVDEKDTVGRMSTLWHTLADIDEDDTGLLLAHELWIYAVRHPEVRGQLARRYQAARNTTARHISSWGDAVSASLDNKDASSGGDTRKPDTHGSDAQSNGSNRQVPDESSVETATLVLALLLGLEMQRRLDPDSVPDELAVEGLMRLFTKAD